MAFNPDPEIIFLEPGEGGDEGRMWCDDNVWAEMPEYGQVPSTKYIRADLVATLKPAVATPATPKPITTKE